MAVPSPVSTVIDRERNRYGTNNLVFPDDLGPQGMFFVFREYNFSSTRGSGFSTLEERSVGDTVLLPIPKALMDSTNLNIQAGQMGFSGEILANVVSASKDQTGMGAMYESGMKTLAEQMPSGSDAMNAVTDFFTGGNSGAGENVSNQVAFLMRRALDRSGMTRSADTGLGSTVNPKSAISFEGVNLKPHTFSWDFAVRSRNESDTVRNIFQTIRRNSLPEYIGMGTSDEQAENSILSRALLKYPSMVDVFLFGLDQSYYYYFKTAMIQSVSINFSPQGNVIMEGGKPGIMTLDLQLLETDIHTSEDYGGGSSGGFTETSTGPDDGSRG